MRRCYHLRMHFKHFDSKVFLAEYWQRKPLLIRDALAINFFQLSPEELAGLACEDETQGIESRLITNKDNIWRLQYGPFDEALFPTLGEADWTLLVQRVDQLIPELAELRECVDFIPGWRFEDIMVSYATRGGGVGPHFDRYDVFLVQGRGHRRWQIGKLCNSENPLRENSDLALLKSFIATDDWTLAPGDVLYLPPGFSHWGTGLDNECMTYSIGFRAPSYQEILFQCCESLTEKLNDDIRYRDRLLIENHAGSNCINEKAITQVRQYLIEHFSEAVVREAFGKLVTATHTKPDNNCSLDERLHQAPTYLTVEIPENKQLIKNPQYRLAYQVQGTTDYAGTLFVNGESCHLDNQQIKLARYLCDNRNYTKEQLSNLTNNRESRQLLWLALDESWIEVQE